MRRPMGWRPGPTSTLCRMTDEAAGNEPRGLSRSSVVEWAVRLLTAFSSVALAVLLVATFAGVVMRYVFAMPVLGGNEIIQLASVALVMLAMPLAGQRGDHVRVDVLDGFIGAPGRFAGDLVSRALAIYLLCLLAWRSWSRSLDAAEFGDATNMLSIPFWPFYALLALGTALYAIVLVLQLVDIVRSALR